MGDYRIFVGAFPEGELAGRIQAVRQRYAPATARITAPHVTLAGTYWRSGPATAANEAEAITRLNEAVRRLQPFDLVLSGVRVFPPASKPVIYLAVGLSAELLAVRQALLAALGMDKHGGRFTPHLTLAMRLAGAQAERMLADLHGGEWDTVRICAPIRALSLMQRGPADKAWREIGKAAIGRQTATTNFHRA